MHGTGKALIAYIDRLPHFQGQLFPLDQLARMAAKTEE
jgi:hypothetical protein